jgi:hypothetical protein
MLKRIIALLMVTFVLVACGSSEPSEGDVQTAIAMTVEALVTTKAEPTNLPKPTDTLAPTNTTEPAVALIPTETISPGPMLRIAGTATIYESPSKDAEQITTLSAGPEGEIIERSSDSLWYKISLSNGIEGWIERKYIVRLSSVSLVGIPQVDVSTPLPIPTPKPTATSVPVIVPGSRQKPHPLGFPVALTYNDSIDFKIHFSSVLRGDEAFQKILSFNSANDPPPDGMEYVLVTATVNYYGSDQGILELDKRDFRVVTNGQAFDSSDFFVCCLVPEFELELFAGGVGLGLMAWPVYINDPNPMLVLGELESGIFLALSPDS